MSVLTRPGDADAAWLTRVLRSCGVLDQGRVAEVHAEAAEASWSHNARLRLRYQDLGQAEAAPAGGASPPASLFLKICAGERAVFGPSEVHYYTRDYRGVPDAPIPRCYHAAWSEAPRAYHLLLEDLGDTHRDQIGVAPTRGLALACAEALARLHAPYFGEGLAGEEVALARYFAHVGRGLAPLQALLGDATPRGWRAALDAVLARHPGLLRQRLAEGPSGLTRVHGDVNPGNVLAPRQGHGRVYLIDRQPFDWSLQTWLAASDLALLLIPYWGVADRRRLEEPVLRHYHRSLAALGIDYPFERLHRDYRLSIAQCLELAVEWCVVPDDRERMRWLWELQLARAMAAFEDHDVAALFADARVG